MRVKGNEVEMETPYFDPVLKLFLRMDRIMRKFCKNGDFIIIPGVKIASWEYEVGEKPVEKKYRRYELHKKISPHYNVPGFREWNSIPDWYFWDTNPLLGLDRLMRDNRGEIMGKEGEWVFVITFEAKE